MDVDTIGAALRRKLGPLPVWIWAIFGGMVVYFLRKRGYFGGGLQEGQTFQPSQANATPPQAQVPLQPGESVYDPNTGALTTAPGGDIGAGTGNDSAQAIDDLASAIAAGFTTHVTVDRTSPRGKSSKKSAAAQKTASAKSQKKAVRAEHRAVQTARRNARKKAGHKQKPGHTGTAKTTHPAHTQRPRSEAKHRTVTGGRTTGRKKGSSTTAKKSSDRSFMGSRAAVATPATTTRQRPTIGLTRVTAPVQHPVSAHTPSPHKAAAAKVPGPPRASAPAPRAIRPAPAPPPARKVAPPPPKPRKGRH